MSTIQHPITRPAPAAGLSRAQYADLAGHPDRLVLPCPGCTSPHCLGWVQTSDEAYAERTWSSAQVAEARRFRAAR